MACAVLITLGNPVVLGEGAVQMFNRWQWNGTGMADAFQAVFPDVTFFAFAAALVLVMTSKTSLRLLGLAVAGAGTVLLHVSPNAQPPGIFYFKLFGIYLPTLVHVFLFTGAFILAGALKRRSLAGYASLGVFLACGGLALWSPNLAPVTNTGAAAVFWSGFRDLSFASLADLMRSPPEQLVGTNVYTSPLVLRLVRFFAFAYTYHYLNWFSKTSIIQWHNISRTRLALLAVLWLASVALYAVNYSLGLRWLFLLSLAHVLLEFPLNHRSFMEIGSELSRRWKAT
jgi:hypothetical protein